MLHDFTIFERFLIVHLPYKKIKTLAMKHLILATLLALSALPLKAQKYAVGTEFGFYVAGKGSGEPYYKGIFGFPVGATATYYPTSRLGVNSGLSIASFSNWNNSRFYRIPLILSYALNQRGPISGTSTDKLNGPLNGVKYASIYHPFELEGGVSFGFYDGRYQDSYHENVSIGTSFNGGTTSKMTELDYSVTRKNRQYVPAITLGAKQSLIVSHVQLYLRLQYSILFNGDVTITAVDTKTGKSVTDDAHQAYSITAGLAYSF